MGYTQSTRASTAPFESIFPELNPVEVTNGLAQEGKIELRPVRGGVMIYKAGEAPAQGRAGDALKKMGLDKGT